MLPATDNRTRRERRSGVGILAGPTGVCTGFSGNVSSPMATIAAHRFMMLNAAATPSAQGSQLFAARGRRGPADPPGRDRATVAQHTRGRNGAGRSAHAGDAFDADEGQEHEEEVRDEDKLVAAPAAPVAELLVNVAVKHELVQVQRRRQAKGKTGQVADAESNRAGRSRSTTTMTRRAGSARRPGFEEPGQDSHHNALVNRAAGKGCERKRRQDRAVGEGLILLTDSMMDFDIPPTTNEKATQIAPQKRVRQRDQASARDR